MILYIYVACTVAMKHWDFTSRIGSFEEPPIG